MTAFPEMQFLQNIEQNCMVAGAGHSADSTVETRLVGKGLAVRVRRSHRICKKMQQGTYAMAGMFRCTYGMIVLIRICPHTRGSAVVPNDVADVGPLPEWASLVAKAVDSPGHKGNRIAECSEQVVRVFSKLNGDLAGHHFSESLISRMRNGKIKKPRREKLIVLKLALLCLDDRSHPDWSLARCEAVLAEAVAFARKVLDAAASQIANGAVNLGYTDARHEHTVELLGAYGEDLLRQVDESGTGEAEAKLALLHQLSGNSDDARYWSDRASVANSEYVHAPSKQELFSRTHCYATEYQRASEPEVAYLYWKYAAEFGDGVAAFRLHQMAELKGDSQEAASWHRVAYSLGYFG